MKKLALALVLLFANGANSFGTINEPLHIGQHSEHERISRAAFRCPPGVTVSDGICFEKLSLMQLAGTSGPDGHVGRGFNGAVGAPDTLDPVPEGPEAHCDNADFLDHEALGLEGGYPQSREQATRELQTCVNHLRLRFGEGLDAADQIVDDYARILEGQVNIQAGDCVFSFSALHLHMFGRAKCSAIEGFGRALHGVQDFYAHSNWVDHASPPYGPGNPPGLKRRDPPIFLDLRAENEIDEQVPRNLSTGCFGGILTDGVEGQPGHPLEPGSKDCTGRITHHTLNKDNGIIDSVTGEAKNPGPNTPRSDTEGNFERAVAAAIKDSKRQWRFFREEARRLYGAERGNMIICAMVRDSPMEACRGRRVAILQDYAAKHDGSIRIVEMQMPLVHWLRAEMEGLEHNEREGMNETKQAAAEASAMTASVRTPWEGRMQSPLVGAFSIDSSYHQQRSVSLNFRGALSSLSSNFTGTINAGKSAIIALPTALHDVLEEQVADIWHAGDSGIRVHLGIVNTPEGLPTNDDAKSQIRRQKQEDLMTAVLRTGGTYSILHDASNVDAFLEHVVSRGLTQLDNARDTATLLPQGITFGDYVMPEHEPRRYSFDAHSFQNAVVSVVPVTDNLLLRVTLRHVRQNRILKDFKIGQGANKSFRAELGLDDVPRDNAWYELEIRHIGGKGRPASGLFEVNLQSQHIDDDENDGGNDDEPVQIGEEERDEL